MGSNCCPVFLDTLISLRGLCGYVCFNILILLPLNAVPTASLSPQALTITHMHIPFEVFSNKAWVFALDSDWSDTQQHNPLELCVLELESFKLPLISPFLHCPCLSTHFPPFQSTKLPLPLFPKFKPPPSHFPSCKVQTSPFHLPMQSTNLTLPLSTFLKYKPPPSTLPKVQTNPLRRDLT